MSSLYRDDQSADFTQGCNQPLISVLTDFYVTQFPSLSPTVSHSNTEAS